MTDVSYVLHILLEDAEKLWSKGPELIPFV